ncbi:NADPH2:quinone reductase [Monoraphidium neglectum]|uniref:NADPH2:quinone reductase n=1 Tax=Monoraphidium neglectum TaxID=145388 RepID=A0A0D2N4I6_9CHLO|nr:NADPH2:quinone reductase [Monoraphidium neglectum]KIZ07187.1 NADPH2:quinone reductase [Monoraphidium neglectum]|eukprot:XP_013906206.1 NADPH2:quinone reductase [Monoraphidium neglectum]
MSRAVRFSEFGPPEVLKTESVERPAVAPGAFLIRNESIGVNFIDIYFRTGLYPAELPNGLGVEGAGVIEEVGENTTHPQGLKPGDRVAYISPGPRLPGSASYAEYSSVPAASVVRLPEGVSAQQGAAVLLQGLTAKSMIEVTTDVKKGARGPRRGVALRGDWVLIHAAAGGTGQLLVQIAHQLGARVIATVSTEEKAAIARSLGAEEVILYGRPGIDVAVEVQRITGGKGAYAAFDGVGQTTFEASLASLGYLGWLVSFGNASGKVPPVDLLRLSDKGIRLLRPSLFSTLKSRDGLFLELAEKLLADVASGAVKQGVHKEYPLEEAGQAHIDLESRGTTGKLLLKP